LLISSNHLYSRPSGPSPIATSTAEPLLEGVSHIPGSSLSRSSGSASVELTLTGELLLVQNHDVSASGF